MSMLGLTAMVGWLFMSPIVIHHGSEALAQTPLASDADEDVRWVARAIDPTTREVTRDGERYWYFTAAPTLEIRVFRETDDPIELVSFEIDDAHNIDPHDVGERLDAPSELKRSRGFEVWPKDETKPISFRFTAEYQSGGTSSTFSGRVNIKSVIPGDIRDNARVQSVPVSHALRVASAGASFGPTADVSQAQAERKRQARERLAQDRARRNQERAEQRQERAQERSEERRQAQADAQRQAAARRQYLEARRQHRRKQDAARKKREAARQARMAQAQQRQREQDAARHQRAQQQATQREQARRQQARRQQARRQQARRQQQVRQEEQRSKRKTPETKTGNVEIEAPPPAVARTSRNSSPRSSKGDQLESGELQFGKPCPKGYTLKGRCPPGVKCPYSGYCARDDEPDETAKKGQARSSNNGENSSQTGSGSSRRSSDSGSNNTPKNTPSGTSSGSNETSEYCPGPADHRRPRGTCIAVSNVKRGKDCGNSDSVRLRVENRCDMRVYMRFCFERSGKSSSCGAFGLGPGKSDGQWTCSGTGAYSYNATFSPKMAKDFTCSDWH